MRNKAGFMILTLLLLTVPALANAWTLAVKVAGGTSTNNVTVAFGTTTKNFQGTSSYVYPVGTTTLTDNGAASAIAFNGTDITAAVHAVGGYVFPVNTSGNNTLSVTYATTQTNSGLTLAQANGGSIYALNLNNTWTTTGVSGLVANAAVTVAIAPDVLHKVTGYTVNGGTAVPVTTGAGVVYTVSLPANNAVIAPIYALVAQTSVSLFAPTNGFTSVPVTCSATATSNDTNLVYSFVATGPTGGVTVPVTTANSFTFKPTIAGTYTVTATVASDNNLAGVTATTSIVVTSNQDNVNQGCESCHSTQSPTIVNNYKTSIHNNSTHSACAGCHTSATPHSAGIDASNISNTLFYAYTSGKVVGPTSAVNKGVIFCTQCHNPIPHDTNLSVGVTCVQCHTSATGKGGTGDAHQIQGLSCTGCHAVGQSNPFSATSLVNDNNGVRAIVGEFSKWSHHVVNANGLAVQDEQCAVCHLEGTVGTYGFGVDGAKHMTDAVVHLRNADTDADIQWDASAPNHSNMDTFCMSCHDSNGATSPMNLKLQALITPLTGKTASPSNPFGDTISNNYDKMLRPAVVDASGQFNTGNNSHHAVKGPRYSKRTRIVDAADSRAMTAAQVAAFTANSSATLPSKRSTIYGAGKFSTLYTPLGNTGGETAPRTGAVSLGDDSTLHCGDCHTVGQFRAADVSAAAGSFNKAVIGAHGSNNEYMLRNNAGTDARHIGGYAAQDGTKPYLVCFNCHVQATYSVNSSSGTHAGEHGDGNNCNGAYNTFGNYTASGSARLLSRTTTGAISKLPGYGNIFGIQCAACHNSGADNGFGGIHGSKIQTYTDGMGNTSKHFRFMPGLNNTKFVPGTLGGFTGGTTAIYLNYSGNRNGTGTGQTSGQTFSAMPVRNTPYITTGYTGKAPSYSYTTGGVSLDTNWEQYKSQVDPARTNPATAGMGCYTLGAVGTAKINLLRTAGYPADDIRLAATDNMKGADGATMFGTWGACDDHNGAQGKGTSPTRGAVRPVTY